MLNLTPHAIALRTAQGEVTIPPSGTAAVKQPGPRTNPPAQTIEEAAKAKAARGDYLA